MHREDEWRSGTGLASAKRPFSPGGQIRILYQAHLAYVTSAEIKMSILSFPLYSFGAKPPVCRSNSPLSTSFPEGEQNLT